MFIETTTKISIWPTNSVAAAIRNVQDEKKHQKLKLNDFIYPSSFGLFAVLSVFFLLSLAFTHKKSELTFPDDSFYLFAMLLFAEFAESTFLLLLFCLISFYQKTTSIRLLRNVQCIGLSIHAERTLIIGKQLQPYQNIAIYFNTHCELLSLQQYFGNDDNTTNEKTAQHSKIKNRQIRNVGTHFFSFGEVVTEFFSFAPLC